MTMSNKFNILISGTRFCNTSFFGRLCLLTYKCLVFFSFVRYDVFLSPLTGCTNFINEGLSNNIFCCCCVIRLSRNSNLGHAAAFPNSPLMNSVLVFFFNHQQQQNACSKNKLFRASNNHIFLGKEPRVWEGKMVLSRFLFFLSVLFFLSGGLFVLHQQLFIQSTCYPTW